MTAPRLDAHCHIFNPRFRLKTHLESPPEPFTIQDYRDCVVPLGFSGGVVVSSAMQGFQQGHLLDSLRWLGPGFVGVTQVSPMVTHAELETLNGFGIRGLRLTLRRGGALLPEQVLGIAKRVHRHIGWHTELAVDARELFELEETLLQLPALSLDHRVLSRPALPSLLRLAERGVRIKVCAPGRFNPGMALMLKDIHDANPNALMFGSGAPLIPGQRGITARDIEALFDTLGDAGAQRALWHNAFSFYRLQTS